MPDLLFKLISAVDGLGLQAYGWITPEPRATVVIAHGAAEHALRYERFATAVKAAGYNVLAVDHRGHGASSPPERLGDYGDSGWNGLVADLGQLVAQARVTGEGRPVVLFGHSMGAMAAQQLAPDCSTEIAALILSGTTAREVPALGDPPPVFAPNAPFEPGARTNYDWLSRDEAEVDTYIADPLCGFETRAVEGQRADPAVLADPERLGRIRPDLPCLFVAGIDDPVNRKLEGLDLLEERWRAAGLRHIDTAYYRGGRHEMLNETNRDEVTADIIRWIGVNAVRGVAANG